LGRRSSRSEEGVVVVEGRSLLDQAVAAGWTVDELYVINGGDLPLRTGAEFTAQLAHGVMERVTTLETPPSVISVLAARPAAMPADATFVVVADRIGDPGNLGTIVRSAEAAGADAVVLTAGSVDPWNPKALRAAAGSSLRLPVMSGSLDDVRAAGLSVVGTSSHRGVPYSEIDLRGRVAIVVGNEAHGLADDAPVDTWATIPHQGPAESINVAMAATVLVFEVARQRRGS
jgi:TrmH family RNA methyltransferase